MELLIPLKDNQKNGACNYSVQVEAFTAEIVRKWFSNAKSIGEADLEWILHRNCEGTEQLPELLKQHKK